MDAAPAPAPLLSPLGLPSPCYFDGTDHLRLTTFNAAAGVTLAVEGRFLRKEGQVTDLVERHVPNTDRTSASSTFPVGEGWLLNVHVRATAGTPRRGQCFVLLEIVRGVTGAVQPVAVLLQGYVTDTARRGWPGSPLELSAEGPGVLRSVTGTDPAANTEISETVPTNARWRLYAVAATLVTDANVANREVALVLDDGATVLARVPSGFSHTASLTKLYSFFRGGLVQTVAQDLTRIMAIPWVDLQGGSRLRTITTNLQATDNYGAPQLLVEEWIED